MTIKNLNIEEYLLGRCDAQQMHQLATCVAGSSKRLRLLFALRCAFLDLKYRHHFQRLMIALYAENYLQTHQLINLSTHQFTNSKTYKLTNLQAHQLTNSPTY